jgi:hypothetical protein
MNHCYILYGSAIGVFPSNIPGTTNQSNIVTSSNGSWKDSEAITGLTGTPINYKTTGIWVSSSLNTPYLLSSYNSEIYNPNMVNSSTNTYISNVGLFKSLYKIISVNNNSPGNNISIDTNSGSITLTYSDYKMNPYIINVLSYQLDSNNNYYCYEINDIIITFILPNICFPKGTLVKTDQEYCEIDKINPHYHTIQNKKIVAIVKTYNHEKELIEIKKDALYKNCPSKKTLISKEHKIYYNGKMIKSKNLLNKIENVKCVSYTKDILYNILMENHEIISVNNMICETLHPLNPISRLYNHLYNLKQKNKKQITMRYTI